MARVNPDGSSWFDFSRNPRELETVGAAIAGTGSELGTEAVVSWLDPDETVLAHVVASHLGVPRASVDVDLGLLTLGPELEFNRSVLLVASAFTRFRTAESLRSLLEDHGHTVVGAVSLSETSGLQVTLSD
jgi:hypothetical protein